MVYPLVRSDHLRITNFSTYSVFKEHLPRWARGVLIIRPSWCQQCFSCFFYSSIFIVECFFFRITGLNGGADRNRTCDPLNANQVLCQLSYSPIRDRTNKLHTLSVCSLITRKVLVGLTRFELVTPRLSSVCSNQLSYRPIKPVMHLTHR